MKLLVIGCGQCGGRIADEFARLNRRARIQRGIGIITNAIAINTDIADLTGLSFIKPDPQHRILIGDQKTGGHGVGKINELGAEIAREDSDKILEGIRTTEHFHDTDAILIIGSAAGGTGSGALPVLAQTVKEMYTEKPLYNLVVLPFRHEERVEERTIYNTATCLKSAYLVADAVFLVDNQRYLKKDFSIQANLSKINARIVEPFYNTLCAGEEKKPKYIGAKILDGGDIIQTLSGWTIIGYGESEIPLLKFPFKGANFRKKREEDQRANEAMNDAINELSLKCNPSDAMRALYLICGPPEEMYVNVINEIGSSLKRIAPEAIIRSGDYPREKRTMHVSLILSEFTSIPKVMDYFTKAIQYISSHKRKREGLEYEQRGIEEAFRGIPSLL